MSSFKNAAKSHQKTHRERGQLTSRKHLGFLEKKKDYKLRADDHQKKKNTIKALKRKALDKNPDEFYFKMVKTRMEDGEHQTEDKLPEYTEEQLKLIQTQDIRYVQYKRSLEVKKIEKLKSSMHLLDAVDKPKNKHTVFVDSKKQAREFDAAQFLDTHPALVGRTYNRPRIADLKKKTVVGLLDDHALAEAAVERSKKYKELTKRIEREKQLLIISQKMEMKKHLMDKKSRKKKVADETKEAAAVYKWVPNRQR